MSYQFRHRAMALSIAVIMLLVAMVSLVPIDEGADAEPSRALPSRVNLSNQVPYHQRAGEDLTGEASLSMIFDYHGPYIMQQDIRNVTKGIAGSGVATTEQLVKASHYSNLVPQTPRGYEERPLGYGAFYYDWNDDDDRVENRFQDLYSALADGHPVLCYMYLDIPPELTEPTIPDPSNPTPPDPQVTPETLAGLEKVWRVVVGYDTNQGNGILIVHDPVPSGTGFLGGKSRTVTRENFDKLWNAYELVDQRFTQHRYSMTAAPWTIEELENPKNVNAGTTFEITAKIVYNSPSNMMGSSVSSPLVSLEIPDEYVFAEGSKSSISLDMDLPGMEQYVSWNVTAPERGYVGQDWHFDMNATGNVTVGNPEPHFDRIGEMTSFEVETIGYLNHPPVIQGSMVDPDLIPDDGSVSAVVSSRVEDEDGNIRTVEVDLSPIGGNSFQVMYDDGEKGDDISGDGIYSYRISKKIDAGEYILMITVKDTLGGRAYDNVTLRVEDAAIFTNAPEITDKGVFPFGVPNDGVTTSVVWAMVEDEEDDIDTVHVDLSEVGGEDNVRMYDDGTSGDIFASDGNYSVEFTVSPLIEISIYQVEITAEDQAGHETSAKVWVDVILPPVPPVVVDVSVLPEEVPNDGETVVVISAIVEDDNDDVEDVWADLTPIKRSDRYHLEDDGIAPDMRAGDGTWTAEFTVPSSATTGLKGKIDVFAEDSQGLQGSAFFSLTVEKSNTSPELGKYNVSNEDGQPMTEFSVGDKVNIQVEVFDEDINDILTVTLDLSDLGLSEITLEDDDEDSRYTGDFTIPANTSGSYNLTVRVDDGNGGTDDMRIRINVKATEEDESATQIDSQYIMIGAIISFLLLLILTIVVVTRKRKTVGGPPPRYPPMQQRPMTPPYGAPQGARPLR